MPNFATKKKKKKKNGSREGKDGFLFGYLNFIHPNINMHILHTVLYTFPKVLTRRICFTVKSFLSWLTFLFILVTLMFGSGWYWKEDLEITLKGQKVNRECRQINISLQ